MIKVNAIKLPEAFDIYKNTNGEKAEFLEPVSKINIFVGSNNSGKSRFMRELSAQSSYDAKVQDINLEEINSKILKFVETIKTKFEELHISEVSHLSINELKKIKSGMVDALSFSTDSYKDIRQLMKNWADYTEVTSYSSQEGWRVMNLTQDTRQTLANLIRDEASQALKFLNQIPGYSKSDFPQKIYIPTLRGLRPLDESHTDLYAKRTKQDYYEEQESTPEIFTGLSLYQEITNLLLGNNTQRKLIDSYQKFISQKLWGGKDVELIPKQKEKVVFVKIGKEEEQPVHHLGDGIQSAIILSFLPFVRREQTFFFIEEPEIYLHPGLQRKILDFYNSPECKNHTFFMTTHSNHFLDISIDIKEVSIFTFRKILDESKGDDLKADFTIESVDSGHESSLELLGVRNSSVFLVNATIWVEGITDRWYFREMINSYMDYLEETGKLDLRLEEDTHYSFVEYGGANITHWSFLDSDKPQIQVERLCARALVIIDNDGDSKIQRKKALKKKLKNRLVELPCREVENLLPYKIIKEIVLEYEKKPKLILPEFKNTDYQDVYLGEFIEDRVLGGKVSRKGGYKADSGTLKHKPQFCEKALKKIQYINLPDSTKEITKNIYKFIYVQNTPLTP